MRRHLPLLPILLALPFLFGAKGCGDPADCALLRAQLELAKASGNVEAITAVQDRIIAAGGCPVPVEPPHPPPTPPPEKHEPVCAPPDLVTGCWHQPPGEEWQFIPAPAPEPTPTPGCSIDGPVGALLPKMTILGEEVNKAILAAYGCDGGRCVVNDSRFAVQRKIIEQLKKQGLCAGQHDPGTGPDDYGTDEIAVSRSTSDVREGYHIAEGPARGPITLLLSPQAARPAYLPAGAPPPEDPTPPPPSGSCGNPLPPKVWTTATLPDGWGENEIGKPRWLIECVPHGNVIDCTAKVAPQACGYCASIDMALMPDGVQPRCGCPVRKEGSPERGPCEIYLTGGMRLEAEEGSGAMCSFAHGNQFQFEPNGGNCRLCSIADPRVCGGWF